MVLASSSTITFFKLCRVTYAPTYTVNVLDLHRWKWSVMSDPTMHLDTITAIELQWVHEITTHFSARWTGEYEIKHNCITLVISEVLKLARWMMPWNIKNDNCFFFKVHVYKWRNDLRKLILAAYYNWLNMRRKQLQCKKLLSKMTKPCIQKKY